MRKDPIKPRVVNVNRRGEVIDPATYVIRRADCPELYKFLEEIRTNEQIETRARRAG